MTTFVMRSQKSSLSNKPLPCSKSRENYRYQRRFLDWLLARLHSSQSSILVRWHKKYSLLRKYSGVRSIHSFRKEMMKVKKYICENWLSSYEDIVHLSYRYTPTKYFSWLNKIDLLTALGRFEKIFWFNLLNCVLGQANILLHM